MSISELEKSWATTVWAEPGDWDCWHAFTWCHSISLICGINDHTPMPAGRTSKPRQLEKWVWTGGSGYTSHKAFPMHLKWNPQLFISAYKTLPSCLLPTSPTSFFPLLLNFLLVWPPWPWPVITALRVLVFASVWDASFQTLPLLLLRWEFCGSLFKATLTPRFLSMPSPCSFPS